MLREYLPEVVCVVTSPAVQVIVAVPERDALSSPVGECAGWIQGAVTEHGGLDPLFLPPSEAGSDLPSLSPPRHFQRRI